MLRLLLICLLASISWLHLRAEELRFAATGCGPYAAEEEPLLAHYVDLVNADGQSEFLVHLGDVVTGAKKQWPESQYAKVAQLLKKSKRPVYVLLGDNEWNDLDNPAEGLEFWNRQFRDFDKHFPNAHQVARQAVRPENFAFVSKGVLIVGLNIVGGRVHDKDEWQKRLQQDADWIAEQFAAHRGSVRAAVVLAQAKPTRDHELFFDQLAQQCVKFEKPVLYLHADGHVWQVEKGWRTPNLWRVQTDQIKLNPPVLVTVTENRDNPFVFDRRQDIGSRRELFVDDWLIERQNGTHFHLHKPKAAEVVVTYDAPWEGNTSAYITMFQDGELYRMVYRGAHFDESTQKAAHPEFACYAESRDGIHWTKPKLGLVEFQGSKDNNIILSGAGTHNFTAFLDANPACAPDARYKALAGDRHGLKAYKSSDCIHWTLMQEKSVITDGDFDSQNLAFWHPAQKRYLAFHRKSRDRVRDIMVSMSTDFLHWNDPRYLEYGDAPKEHLYTNAIRPYSRAPHILLGFPTRFQPKTQQVEPIFMSSRDGLHFRRSADELIPITAPENRDGNRSNYMTNALLELPGRASELSLYATEAYYKGPGSRVRRFTIRTDGFMSLRSEETMSEFVTKPFTFSGDSLHVNYSVRSGGSLRVEVQDHLGKPLPGLGLEDCQPLTADEIDGLVRWPGASLGALQIQPVKLRVQMQQADIWSIQFSNDQLAERKAH